MSLSIVFPSETPTAGNVVVHRMQMALIALSILTKYFNYIKKRDIVPVGRRIKYRDIKCEPFLSIFSPGVVTMTWRILCQFNIILYKNSAPFCGLLLLKSDFAIQKFRMWLGLWMEIDVLHSWFHHFHRKMVEKVTLALLKGNNESGWEKAAPRTEVTRFRKNG